MKNKFLPVLLAASLFLGQPANAQQWGSVSSGSISGNVGLNAGSAIIGKVGIDQTTPGTTNGVQVNAALPAGTNIVGKMGIDQTTPGTTNKVSIGTDGTVAINAAIPAGSNFIGSIGGNTVEVSASQTRPADTTAYTALDAINVSTSSPTVLSFSNACRVNAGSGYITQGMFRTDQSTNTARIRLHLYHTSPTAINDNAQFTTLWANRAKTIGTIDFDAAQTEGTGSDSAYSVNNNIRIPFVCDGGSTTIYALPETLDAFTPANAQNFDYRLKVEQN